MHLDERGDGGAAGGRVHHDGAGSGLGEISRGSGLGSLKYCLLVEPRTLSLVTDADNEWPLLARTFPAPGWNGCF